MNKLYVMLGVFYKFMKVYVALNRQNKYITKSLYNLDLTLERCKGDPVVVIFCYTVF